MTAVPSQKTCAKNLAVTLQCYSCNEMQRACSSQHVASRPESRRGGRLVAPHTRTVGVSPVGERDDRQTRCVHHFEMDDVSTLQVANFSFLLEKRKRGEPGYRQASCLAFRFAPVTERANNMRTPLSRSHTPGRQVLSAHSAPDNPRLIPQIMCVHPPGTSQCRAPSSGFLEVGAQYGSAGAPRLARFTRLSADNVAYMSDPRLGRLRDYSTRKSAWQEINLAYVKGKCRLVLWIAGLLRALIWISLMV